MRFICDQLGIGSPDVMLWAGAYCVLASAAVVFVPWAWSGLAGSLAGWVMIPGVLLVVLGGFLIAAGAHLDMHGARDFQRTRHANEARPGDRDEQASRERARENAWLFDRHAVGLSYFVASIAFVTSLAIAGLAFNGAFTPGNAQMARAALEHRDLNSNAVWRFGKNDAALGAPSVIDVGGSMSTELQVLVRGAYHGVEDAPALDGQMQSSVLIDGLVEIKQRAESASVLVLVSTALSLVGVFFFVGFATRRNMLQDNEEFVVARFWTGIFLGTGQAVIYMLVFFLLLAWQNVESFGLLPLLALVTGMFIKSGERVIFGLAQRVFAAVEVLLPAHRESGPDDEWHTHQDDRRRERAADDGRETEVVTETPTAARETDDPVLEPGEGTPSRSRDE